MADTLTPIQILAELVGFPTVSRDTNLPLIDWVEEYLTGHGIDCHRFYHESGEKAALFAHVGPWVEGGIVLSGHTDVVPVDGQDWSTDPFVLTEKDGRLYGRGSCDMKGFDALAIWAMVEAKRRGVTRPLQIALSFDEEVGCTGAPPMIQRMLEVLPKAELALIGEPSMMKVVTSHKGSQAHITRIIGHEVHSSTPHLGVSAIMEAGRLIHWANEVNEANSQKPASGMDALFEPSWTTAHVGTIHGGTAQNITAGECRFGLDFRVVPGDDGKVWEQAYLDQVARVEAAMQATCPDTRIEVTSTFSVTPLRPEDNGPAEALARALTGDNGTHVVSYATEAGQFQDAGYSACVCGPGDIAQAHQGDEFIEITQMHEGQAFLERMLDRMA
jgi:acetylornithine deacetylase